MQIHCFEPVIDCCLPGGGDDTSIGLWVMGYNIPYFDDRRLGVYYETGECPDNFVGKQPQLDW